MSKGKKSKRDAGQNMRDSDRPSKKSHFKTDNKQKKGFQISENEDLFFEDGPTQKQKVSNIRTVSICIWLGTLRLWYMT